MDVASWQSCQPDGEGNRKFRATHIYYKALPMGGLVYKNHTELLNSKVYLNKFYE